MKNIVLMLACVFLLAFVGLACSQFEKLSKGDEKPVAAVDLGKEYQHGKAQFTGKYQNKELTVRGYAPDKAGMLAGGGDKGLVILTEKGDTDNNEIWCEFSKDDLADFQKVTGKQYVTAKGRIDVKEAGLPPYLTSCKLVKVE